MNYMIIMTYPHAQNHWCV